MTPTISCRHRCGTDLRAVSGDRIAPRASCRGLIGGEDRARAASVGDVATRAGVSLAAFYGAFPSKDACVFAGYHRFIEVLLQRMAAVAAPEDDATALSAGLIGAYLDTLGQDLVVARAYQVEIDALGAEARAHRRDALTLMARYIQERHTGADLPWTAYIGVVYAARQLASDALDTEHEPDLAALAADLNAWVGDLLRGHEQ